MKVSAALQQSHYPWKDIPGSSHKILLSRILDAGPGLAVLDLGFGAGQLARRIRDRCRYLAGIELDPVAAREGDPYFDDPVHGDILDGLRGPWREPFDVVVAGDVLEHLPDPAVALRVLHGLMRPGGLFLCSLPNVANVTVRMSLLAGRFPYADRGILDRTHLKFFTRKSAVELLTSAGFQVRRVIPTAMPVELALPWLERTPLLGAARAAASVSARAWPTLFGYQFVLEATPA
ncbi:MAG TPA: class I SAM-dependent methyltransferase [Thermoanaerobaculia bacterium]|nr:class I SAM-dependent methyltransferase [Thermoanaerobaculia bacterium]